MFETNTVKFTFNSDKGNFHQPEYLQQVKGIETYYEEEFRPSDNVDGYIIHFVKFLEKIGFTKEQISSRMKLPFEV